MITKTSPRAAQRKSIEEVHRRAWHLREFHLDELPWRRRIRDICNGGSLGLSALLGDLPTNSDTLPASNLILSGITRLAQRLGKAPDVRVDVPIGNESESARRAAERRERIIQSYDGMDGCRMSLQLPQAARWLIGYGFVPWVIREWYDCDGMRFPMAEMRDPIDTYPGPWGPHQQPEDIMFLRRVPRETLLKLYPHARGKIEDRTRGKHGQLTPLAASRVVSANSTGQVSGGWEGADDAEDTLEVFEYYDAWGCYVLTYDGQPLDAYPSVLRSGPAFVCPKRFAFDRLQGQFDHVIGLLAGMARLNVLAELATQDAVFAETVVTGRIDHEYRKGRNAVNFVEGGTVQKVQSNLPYQMFQEIDRIERQLRVTSGYAAQSDGESPLSFATGRGLNELASGVDAEIQEYQTVLTHGLQDLDRKRLEWDDNAYPAQERTVTGEHRGASYADTYIPSKHIKGNYRTRRAYGAMAGWDDYQKIVAGLQLLAAGVISVTTMRENLHGLDNLVREEERVQAEQVKSTLMAMMASGQPVDPRVPLTLAELLPDGRIKEMILKYWTPNDPQMSPQEDALVNGPPQPEGPMLPEAPPDVTTALSLLRANGKAEGGVQSVARL